MQKNMENPMTKKLLLGAHMSIAGGLQNAIARGQEIGCTAIQIFTKSNRQWHAKPLTIEDIDLFKAAWQKSSIQSVVAHASYLINIGSPKKDIAQKSIQALITEIERCSVLGIVYLTLHPGARLASKKEGCLERIAQNLDIIFDQTPTNVNVSLETMAGQGSNVCDSFEDIAFIIKKSKQKKRISVTFDTCHIYAAGYDIANKKKYKETFQQFDAIIGLKKLKVIHINNSKRELASHVDRHEEIDGGKIDLEFFRLLMNDSRFFDTPKILETPEIGNYKKNMNLLESLLNPKNKALFNIK